MSSFSDIIPMYEGINGSPITTLLTQYTTNDDTILSITVRDGTCIPDAPNIITIYTSAGINSGFAVIKYGSKNDNVLSDITVLYKNSDSDISFPVGTFVSRKYAEEDHHAFKHNIEVLSEVTRALIEYIQPVTSIEKFDILDLDHIMPLNSEYTGIHELIHKEILPQFIEGKLNLYEDGIKILEITPASEDTVVEFEASLKFDELRTYKYILESNDMTGKTEFKTYEINVINPMCVGHLSEPVMSAELLESMPYTSECYDGMIVTITADNDYVWFCIAQPSVITEISSYGFTVPTEPVQVVERMVGNKLVKFNCYRTTAKVAAGYENKFKINIVSGN